jgi:hypothetical protein
MLAHLGALNPYRGFFQTQDGTYGRNTKVVDRVSPPCLTSNITGYALYTIIEGISLNTDLKRLCQI